MRRLLFVLLLALAACAPSEPASVEANRARTVHLKTVIDVAGATADADTMAELGGMLVFHFDGVERDTARGTALLRRAYDGGSGQAALFMGWRTPQRDEATAKRYYREAIARGELRAYGWLNTF